MKPMTKSRYGIHWLSVVVKGPKQDAFMYYEMLFKDLFGPLDSHGNGGRGFDQIWFGLLGFKVYASPRRGDVEYFEFEIPGQACEQTYWGVLQGMDDLLRNNYPDLYHYTRLDFAFDGLPFTPEQVEEAIASGKVRSLAKRDTLTLTRKLFEKQDNGETGTSWATFGSRFSERMIRVYNRRGFTRLELELKGKRADLVAKELLHASDVSEWLPLAVSHLRDFVDFDAPWWSEFVGGIGRAWAIVTTPREIKIDRMDGWAQRSLAAPLSVLHDVRGERYISKLLTLGREKRLGKDKYTFLLEQGKREREAKEEEAKEEETDE